MGDYQSDHENLAGSISDFLRKEELGEVYEERRADQDASWWLANRVHDCLAESFSQPISSQVAVLHYVTAYFGTLAAVIHLSTSDEFGTEKPVDHPTFETRLEGVWESLENFVHEKYQLTCDWKGAPVSDVIGHLVKRTDEQVALVLLGYNITHMVHELRKAVEIEVFGKPSKYAFSLHELGWRQDL